jgi:hypothetical protein
MFSFATAIFPDFVLCAMFLHTTCLLPNRCLNVTINDGLALQGIQRTVTVAVTVTVTEFLFYQQKKSESPKRLPPQCLSFILLWMLRSEARMQKTLACMLRAHPCMCVCAHG